MRASNFNPDFLEELLKAYRNGLTVAQMSDYFGMPDADINEALDLILPIWETMGRISMPEQEEDNDKTK